MAYPTGGGGLVQKSITRSGKKPPLPGGMTGVKKRDGLEPGVQRRQPCRRGLQGSPADRLRRERHRLQVAERPLQPVGLRPELLHLKI